MKNCINGWKGLFVDDELLYDEQQFQFWLRMYQSGLIYNEKLKKQDEDELSRLVKMQKTEEDQDADEREI